MGEDFSEPKQRLVTLSAEHQFAAEERRQEFIDAFGERLKEYGLELGKDVLVHADILPPTRRNLETKILAKVTFTAPVTPVSRGMHMELERFLNGWDEARQR